MGNKLDLRIYKTYKALHTAFTELLDEKSFEELTVNELCDRAMIRRATFYSHFPDKYEYFNYYLAELCDEFKQHISQEPKTLDTQVYAINMLYEVFKFVQSHKKILYRTRNSNRMSFLYNSLQEQIAIELRSIIQKNGTKKTTPELELVISFYAGGLINTIYWWINNPDIYDENTIAEQIVTLLPLPIDI